ncbi:telethonin isoform X2 [Heterocephalus glaber]|uniref:Telethonin isoform X2 n=1 Tax=Heterocephalus glaber TaxID=10181 RepID=A0AAX6R2U6_HETGA|nr:telethonin isoform X2 [Heterocephalus glaber]
MPVPTASLPLDASSDAQEAAEMRLREAGRPPGHSRSVTATHGPCGAPASCSVREEDPLRHEAYHQQGQCQALVQRSPWLLMRMGILGRGLQEYQLPYQRVLPLPIFTPTKVGAAKEEREETPVQLRELLALETALGGQSLDRQDMAEITKQLPPVVSVSKPGALRRTLSRSMSQEAQRG